MDSSFPLNRRVLHIIEDNDQRNPPDERDRVIASWRENGTNEVSLSLSLIKLNTTCCRRCAEVATKRLDASSQDSSLC